MPPKKHPATDRPITLIHHAANCGHHEPPGSLSALKACLARGAAVIEIDVLPLADGSFALLHDADLSVETNGTGSAPQMRRDEVKSLRYRVNDTITGEKVGFLEQAIELLIAHPDTRRLQLDLKPFTPLTKEVFQGFLALIDPVLDRIQVTSGADWAIRGLAERAPHLSLGFDPLLYLDLVDDEPRPAQIPPFRVGAYGLRDDHPLSAYQWGTLGDYLAARAAALLNQAPVGCEWFIRAQLLKLALDAGFDWIDFLHQHGSRVDAWTIDVSYPEQIQLAHFLVDHGLDALTTDAPAELAAQLSGGIIF